MAEQAVGIGPTVGGGAADAQRPGDGDDVALAGRPGRFVGLTHHVRQGCLPPVTEAGSGRGPGLHRFQPQRARLAEARLGQIGEVDLIPAGEDDALFHQVLQLPRVARPVIVPQRLHGGGGEPDGPPPGHPA